MWYVNQSICALATVVTGFYINYVVCKWRKQIINITRYNNSFILTMWYVNNRVLQSPTKKLNCFILTMWYVNTDEELEQLHNQEFYINYVVCKYNGSNEY